MPQELLWNLNSEPIGAITLGFIGDIFRAPLAIEELWRSLCESTFIIMFLGLGQSKQKFHLLSSWLVALGSNLSALWILVANSWMQHPVEWNLILIPCRNEMVDFGRFSHESVTVK